MKTQFRIEFTATTFNGNKKVSSAWFNTIEEVKESKWISEPNAAIISREIPTTTQTLAEWKASRNK